MRKLNRVLVAALFGLTAVGVTATPAHADSADCPANRFCVWTNATYTGRFAYFSVGSADLRTPIGGYVFNNRISSLWNRTGQSWCLFDDPGYGPPRFVQSAGGFRANLAIDGFNDKASSLRAC
jgi:hypothetical protein